MSGLADRLRPAAAQLDAWAPQATASELAFAAQATLAMLSSLFVAFAMGLDRPDWAAVTAFLMVQDTDGQAFWRGLTRIGGTLAGIGAGLAFLSCFAQDGGAMTLALAAWGGACAFLARDHAIPDAYACAVAALTTALVVLGAAARPDLPAIHIALARGAETTIGVLANLVVGAALFPRPSGPVAAGLAAAVRADLTAHARTVLAPSGAAAPEFGPAERRQAAQRLAALDVEIEALTHEGAVGLGRARAARALSSQLVLAFVELDALAHRLRRCGTDETLAPEIRMAWREAGEDLAPGGARAAADRLEAAARAAFPLDALAGATGARIGPALARWRARRSLLRLAGVLRAEATTLAPRAPVALSPAAAAETRRALARRDRGLAAAHGLRVALAYLLALLAWRYSGWASGGLAAALAGGMTTIVSIVLPRAAHAGAGRQVALGTLAAAAPLAALQAVAPGLEGFVAFALVCTPFLFAFSLIGAPRTRRLTGVGAIFLFGFGLEPANAGFAPPLQLANTVLVLMAAAAIQHLALTLVLPETSERSRRLLDRGMRRLLADAARRPPPRPADFAATAFDLLGDHAGALDFADPADRRRLARVSAAIVLGAELVELNRYATDPEAPPFLARQLAHLRGAMATLALRPTLGATPHDLLQAEAAVEALRAHLAQAPSPATQEALMIALHLRETLAEDRLCEPRRATPPRELVQ